jgi:hypothetical protein
MAGGDGGMVLQHRGAERGVRPKEKSIRNDLRAVAAFFGQDLAREAVHQSPAVDRRSRRSLEGVVRSLIGRFSRGEVRSGVWSSGGVLWPGRLDGEENKGVAQRRTGEERRGLVRGEEQGAWVTAVCWAGEFWAGPMNNDKFDLFKNFQMARMELINRGPSRF